TLPGPVLHQPAGHQRDGRGRHGRRRHRRHCLHRPRDGRSRPMSEFTENETNLSEETWAELRDIAARYPQARSGLLPMLHLVQSVEGRITPEGIEACAEILGISAAE